MARSYQLTFGRRLGNAILTFLTARGWGSKTTWLLTVRGRKTGAERTTPVIVLEDAAGRWLVAPYGEVGWVKNARAAGVVTIHRGKTRETVRLDQVDAATAAPILKRYVNEAAITRPYFDAKPGDPLEAFAAEASRHPVFHIISTASGAVADS